MATADPDDLLDGMCDVDFEVLYPTTDELVPWVVLFADLIGPTQHPDDWAAVERRAHEWRVLFGGHDAS